MPIKLAVKLKRGGKLEVIGSDLPDLDEAKRLWLEGKSAQWNIQRHRKQNKRESGP